MAKSLTRPIRMDAAAINDALSRAYAKRAVRTLGALRKAFALNRTDTGRLFRVTPEAVLKWERNGVPLTRLAEIDRCYELAELMQRRLKKERIPALVRTPAADFAGKTVLDVIAERGTAPIFEYLRRQASGIPR